MIKPRLILASISIGRKMLLEKLGIPFTIKASNVDEEKIIDKDPYVLIQKRAAAKAESVVKQLTMKPCNHKAMLILACDSAAICDKKVYGKPKNRKTAFKIIKQLQGKTHILATAMTVTSITQSFNHLTIKPFHSLSKTRVTLRQMTDDEITHYVHRYDLRRFAAGYALNETPWDMITNIEGSFTNVIGLPFEQLLPILKKHSLIKTPTTSR